jgi:hypothetical protein
VSVTAGCSTNSTIIQTGPSAHQTQRTARTPVPGAHHPAPTRPPTSAPAITDDRHRLALLSTPLHPRTAVRRGAASCQAVLCSCPVTAAAGVVTAEPSWVAERRRCCNPSEVCAVQPAVAVVRGRRGCPDAGHAVRRSVRVLCPPCGRTSVQLVGRTSGVHASGVQATVSRRPVSTQPVRSGCPDGHPSGVRGRCIQAVRTALDPEYVAAAGQATFGAPGSTCHRGPRAAWSSLPGSGLAGRMVERWQCVARTSVDARPGPPLGMRAGCGAALAA